MFVQNHRGEVTKLSDKEVKIINERKFEEKIYDSGRGTLVYADDLCWKDTTIPLTAKLSADEKKLVAERQKNKDENNAGK